MCIIRGKPKAGLNLDRTQRGLFNFMDDRSRLFMIDVDKFESVIYDEPWLHPVDVAHEYIAGLPAEFHGVSFVLQLSSSCGHPSAGRKFKAHLWFWLKEPMFCREAELYTQVKLKGPADMTADMTVHRTVQPNFTGNPVIHGDQADTAPERLFFCQGWADDVLDIEPVDPLDSGITDVAPRMGRDGMVDPREKPGVIGAVCRAFSPEQIVDLFPENFKAGSTERRITWLDGNGSKEGVCVCDNGTHLYNSQNTAPVTHACNIFDFIRIHVFGHLDADLGDGVAELDVTATRSYELTKAWALQQPEVQAELHSDEAVEVAHVHAEKVADKKEQQLELVETKLENLQALVASMNSLADMETKLFPRVQAARGLTPAQRDLLVGLVKDRSKELGIKLTLPAIRESLKPAPGTEGTLGATLPNLSPAGQPQLTIDNLSALCAARGVTIRKDVIRKRVEILAPGEAFSTGGAENESLAWLQSECAKVNMNINTGQLKSYVSRLAALNQFNPVLTWIESKPWDGVDRLPELYATITHAKDFDQSLKEKMIRKWVIQAVAVAASPVPIQARGVLVVQGAQYLGKSRWLQSLCPGHRDLVTTGCQLDPRNKDSVKIAISHWLCEFGELDGTMGKNDTAHLKAFIANETDTMRLPYAAAENTTQRQTVFYGSVNDEEFLSDTTGNTRFWVIPVTAMDHNHTVDMQQLWAQVLHLWRAGEVHWLSQEDMKLVDASASRFAKTDDIGLLLEEKYDPSLPLEGQNWWTGLYLARLLGLGAKLGDGRGFAARLGRSVAAFVRGKGGNIDDHKKRIGAGNVYRLQLRDDALAG